jgi:hypothetical protein
MNKAEWRSGKDYQRDYTDTNRYRRSQMKKQLIRNILIGLGILVVVSVFSFILLEKTKHY